MANILTSSFSYQGTFIPGTITVAPVYQVCAVANINASNQLEATIWLNINGQRLDNDLITTQYTIRDKNGTAVSGLNQTGIAPDINGFFKITPVSAALLTDLTHFVMDISIGTDDGEVVGSVGLVRGE